VNVKNFSVVDHFRINSFIFPDTHKELSIIPGLEHLRQEVMEEKISFSDSMILFFTPFTQMSIMFVILLLLILIFIINCTPLGKKCPKLCVSLPPPIEQVELQHVHPRIVSIEEA
jgi:hypothetical protein